MLARVFEEHGLTTTAIVLIKEMALRVKPPRALAVPFPFGYALGQPQNPVYQHKVLAAALELLQYNETPVLAEYPDEPGRPVQLIQASDILAGTHPEPKPPAAEITALRGYYVRWLTEHNGGTAVGVTGIPQERFRTVVRFLEAYTQGEKADMEERPAEISLAQFIRLCVDDLKAFAYEARMAQRPQDTEEELHRWFWGETGLAQLAKAVTARMAATGDPELKSIASGIAR